MKPDPTASISEAGHKRLLDVMPGSCLQGAAMTVEEPERFILIVEDDPIVASYLRDVVEENGVVRTTDYARFHRRLSERRYDAAVVGLDAAYNKSLVVIGLLSTCGLPVVAYSAFPIDPVNLRSMHGVQIVTAPQRDAELAELISRLLQSKHGQPTSHELATNR